MIAHRASRQFLAARIQQNYKSLRQLDHDLFFQKRQLEFSLERQHFDALMALCERAELQERLKTKERQKQRFDTMLSRKKKPPVGCSTTSRRWVVNLSSCNLTHGQEPVLSRGLNFSPAPHKVPVPHMVATIG